MANSKRKCAYCKARKPSETMHIVGMQAFCNIDHWIENQVKNKDKLVKKGEKIQRSELKKRKESLRPRSWYLSEAQKWFNKFIRLRDSGDSCISCNRTMKQIQGNDGWKPGGSWDCGHYLTRGARPELRFNELNAHKQCKSCNAGSGKFSHKAATVGRIYRKKLIEKIGIEKVEWIECEANHPPKKYTIEQLKELIVEYKAKCKALE